VNALLAELDGVAGCEGVVVIVATNLPDAIDDALRRSGRLDRELHMSLPSADMLAKILAAYLPGLPTADLVEAAQAARSASGADCERWARETRRSARVACRPVELADLLVAISPASDPLPEAILLRLAFHEAGHAVAAEILRPGSVVLVSIRAGAVGRSSLGGVELVPPGPGEDTPEDVAAMLYRQLAGRAAEILVFGGCGGGSGGSERSDLARATLVSASAELSWGMGNRLTWTCDPDPATLGHILAVHRDVAIRVEARLTDALAAATSLLVSNRGALDAMAEALMQRGTLTGEDARKIVHRHYGRQTS